MNQQNETITPSPKVSCKSKKKTDNITRAAIVHESIVNGAKQCDIAQKLNVSKLVVTRVLKHYRETGSHERVKNSGRPLKLKERDAREITREIVRDPTQTLVTLRKMATTPTSSQTFRTFLRRQGISRNHLTSQDLQRNPPKNA